MFDPLPKPTLPLRSAAALPADDRFACRAAAHHQGGTRQLRAEHLRGFGHVTATHAALPDWQRSELRAAFQDMHRPTKPTSVSSSRVPRSWCAAPRLDAAILIATEATFDDNPARRGEFPIAST